MVLTGKGFGSGAEKGLGLTRILRSPAKLVLLLVVLAGIFLGWFRPADDLMQGWRFSAVSRPVSGNIVLIDIDPATLATIGVWPWPREIHAQIIDNLMQAGASDVAFDIDFSTASNPQSDAELERALTEAGGFVMLATFLQSSSGDEKMVLNAPLARFGAQSSSVGVNVPVDGDGVARRYPYGLRHEGVDYPSMASGLAWTLSGGRARGGDFAVDFSIDAGSIARISAQDIITGDFDPAQVVGKRMLVGTSALELRDNLAVPRYGILPGAALQILAAETLIQNRVVLDGGIWLSIAIVLLATLLFDWLWRRASFGVALGTIIGAVVAWEIGALVALSQWALAVNTAAQVTMLIGYLVILLWHKLGATGLKLASSMQAHHATRGVLDRVISDNFDGVVVINGAGNIVAASQLAAQFLDDSTPDALLGRDMASVLPNDITATIQAALKGGVAIAELGVGPQELTLSNADGDARLVEYVVTRSDVKGDKHGGASGRSRAVVCLTFRDITDRRANEKRLEFLAHHDALTGALSRTRLVEEIEHCLQDEAQRAEGMMVFLLDLSRFKIVNDTLGHSYGDEVLKQVVSRLRACDVDAIARLGGDSFALMRAGVMSPLMTEQFCEHVLAEVSAVYLLSEHRALIGANMGVTDSSVSGYDPELLISHADMALSATHDKPGNTYERYVPAMDAVLQGKQEMELALRAALAKNELSLRYQPQVLLENEAIVGVEALVRWTHPKLGSISPAHFIPIAEETGLILDLGRWILDTACQEAMLWPSDIMISVNFSPMQFEFGDVVGDVERALALSGLPPERLEVEITEGVLIADADTVIDVLRKLRALGVQIALDDFGTGYSSLSYLGQLPFDKIKIDQCFVKGLPGDQESGAVIRAVMTLSESLGKIVIAEGIENADQAWILRLAGCHIGQGYHFGRPLDAADLQARIAEQDAEAGAVAV